MTTNNIKTLHSISAIQPLVEQDEKCCSSSHCSSNNNKQKAPQNPQDKSTNSQLESWKVFGMDCPSCAQKIEKAVAKIPGVDRVQVLFATEKLLVNFTQPATTQQIEQACQNTGFTLNNLSSPTSENTNNKPANIVKDNLQIISIAAAMLIGALAKIWSPEISQWIFTLTCLVGLYPIGKKAIQLAKSGTPFAIETLMSVAALGALYLGETAEAAMVLLLFLIGERLEAFAASRARSGVQSLMELVPENATKIVNDERVIVAAASLQPGDIVEVSPGSRLPADGQLQDDCASFDESALTGESIPVEHQKGDNVMAGSIATDRVVRFMITSKQGENAIDRILHLIEDAESRKAPLERFLDKFSRWYTPLMMLVALAVIITPPLVFSQPWETWVYRGLALLLIACPCALVISTPAAITSGLATAARRGALIKGGAALEQLGKVEIMAFDKTGTLTQGKPDVTDIISLNGTTEKDLMRYASAVEIGSNHPLATSFIRKVEAQGIVIPEASNKQALAGVGVQGEVDGKLIQIMSPSKMKLPLDAETLQQVEQLESQGKTVVVVILNNQTAMGIIAWQDTLRSDSKQAIKALHKLGIRSIMLTGDNPRSAETISSQLSMEYKASLLPQDKVTFVEQLAQQSHVAMIGDGINDAPAMKAASVSVAMGGGTDVALETADSALTHNRLTELPAMIELSKATLANIRQNVTLALGLKAVFLVTSLLGITGLWVAVLADSGATALVTLNALRLLRFEPKNIDLIKA
ncbi:zinc/cadmium/mercury/lead-transporting ATPase [Vibrio sp. CK2-1]|uniref:zinc/cadmium/mercury/lead-transporting ATPase n=1 Tax=Vibrio sp. CK2-1 TaxID=2912249 RepID=UPI001F00AAEB|nr:zinc/cadmium/mercury/lead-transporting ATPase [Vibrio sp. CK2-1]MCF7354979.1 zinc/cadmium/mercury/lead-transporting ATPase [Vibrio sp. CK2-1]